MLSTKNLSFGYSPDQTLIFPDIVVEPNQTLLVLGNSGSGKTTFLNLIGLFLKPMSGQISIDKQSTQNLNEKSLVDFRAKNVGIVFQKPYFVNSLNVIDNLLLTNYLSKSELNKEKAIKLSTDLGFEHLLQKKVTELSGGEQQRICIARALMNKPKIILADEPTSALDDNNCNSVINLLEKQTQEIGAALIIVTHDQRLKSRFSNQIAL
jgi:ABC-type lipoprotein export system ATPase subunit